MAVERRAEAGIDAGRHAEVVGRAPRSSAAAHPEREHLTCGCSCSPSTGPAGRSRRWSLPAAPPPPRRRAGRRARRGAGRARAGDPAARRRLGAASVARPARGATSGCRSPPSSAGPTSCGARCEALREPASGHAHRPRRRRQDPAGPRGGGRGRGRTSRAARWLVDLAGLTRPRARRPPGGRSPWPSATRGTTTRRRTVLAALATGTAAPGPRQLRAPARAGAPRSSTGVVAHAARTRGSWRPAGSRSGSTANTSSSSRRCPRPTPAGCSRTGCGAPAWTTTTSRGCGCPTSAGPRRAAAGAGARGGPAARPRPGRADRPARRAAAVRQPPLRRPGPPADPARHGGVEPRAAPGADPAGVRPPRCLRLHADADRRPPPSCAADAAGRTSRRSSTSRCWSREPDAGGTARFRLLDTLRLFALEQLAADRRGGRRPGGARPLLPGVPANGAVRGCTAPTRRSGSTGSRPRSRTCTPPSTGRRSTIPRWRCASPSRSGPTGTCAGGSGSRSPTSPGCSTGRPPR